MNLQPVPLLRRTRNGLIHHDALPYVEGGRTFGHAQRLQHCSGGDAEFVEGNARFCDVVEAVEMLRLVERIECF